MLKLGDSCWFATLARVDRHLFGEDGADEYKPVVFESKAMCGQENTGRPERACWQIQKKKVRTGNLTVY